MNSLATVQQGLLPSDLVYLSKVDPELYMIKLALTETDVNPLIIPQVIRAIANMTYGAGYGKIQIFMQARVITQIKPEESVAINMHAINRGELNGQ